LPSIPHDKVLDEVGTDIVVLKQLICIAQGALAKYLMEQFED
jgi:hypothetical protein